MAKFNIRAILSLVLIIWGLWWIAQAGATWLGPLVGGNPVFGILLGIIILIIGAYIGKKSIGSIAS